MKIIQTIVLFGLLAINGTTNASDHYWTNQWTCGGGLQLYQQEDSHIGKIIYNDIEIWAQHQITGLYHRWSWSRQDVHEKIQGTDLIRIQFKTNPDYSIILERNRALYFDWAGTKEKPADQIFTHCKKK